MWAAVVIVGVWEFVNFGLLKNVSFKFEKINSTQLPSNSGSRSFVDKQMMFYGMEHLVTDEMRQFIGVQRRFMAALNYKIPLK
jgi:hypothetical protein